MPSPHHHGQAGDLIAIGVLVIAASGFVMASGLRALAQLAFGL